MNGPIRKVAVFVAILMAALLANTTYLTIFRQDELLADGRNRRVRDAEFAQNRGAILVGNTPIAESVHGDDDRFPYVRKYSDGDLWSSVTGWYSYDYARSGLEQSYNDELAGTSSEQSFTRIMDVLTGKASQGANVSTALNAKAQRAAVNALGDKRGAAIAMDYTTGEILALVSTPTYDPNKLSDTDLTAARDSWNTLLNDKQEPLKNRATKEIYPPGSTFKLVTASAAIEAGMVPSTELDAPASLPLPGSSRSLGNSTNCGGTRITMEQALDMSCNTAFGSLGIKLGADKLQAMAEAYGFNKDQTIDIAAAKSRFPTDLDAAQTALSAIGQYEVAASPLQMLQVAAAIANDGVMMKPYIASAVTNRDLSVLSSNKPTELGQPISKATAGMMQQMMESVVTSGTGKPAQVAGLTVGGKTGTAQWNLSKSPYAWFVGYAKEPHVAVVAFVENADVARDDVSGGRLAAPIFTSILEALR